VLAALIAALGTAIDRPVGASPDPDSRAVEGFKRHLSLDTPVKRFVYRTTHQGQTNLYVAAIDGDDFYRKRLQSTNEESAALLTPSNRLNVSAIGRFRGTNWQLNEFTVAESYTSGSGKTAYDAASDATRAMIIGDLNLTGRQYVRRGGVAWDGTNICASLPSTMHMKSNGVPVTTLKGHIVVSNSHVAELWLEAGPQATYEYDGGSSLPAGIPSKVFVGIPGTMGASQIDILELDYGEAENVRPLCSPLSLYAASTEASVILYSNQMKEVVQTGRMPIGLMPEKLDLAHSPKGAVALRRILTEVISLALAVIAWVIWKKRRPALPSP